MTVQLEIIRAQAIKAKGQLLDNIKSCQVCGFGYTPLLIIHHIVPVAEGGENDKENLAILCPNCHALIHHMINTSAATISKQERRGMDNLMEQWRTLSEFIDGLPLDLSSRLYKLFDTYQRFKYCESYQQFISFLKKGGI